MSENWRILKNKKNKRYTIFIVVTCVLSMAVIIGTILHYLTDLMVRVAVLEAEVEYLKKEKQNASELEPMQPEDTIPGGDVL